MLIGFESDKISNSNDIVLYGKLEYYVDNDLPYSNELDREIYCLLQKDFEIPNGL